MGSIGTTRVKDVMTSPVVAVSVSEKMPEIAKQFKSSDINAAPVIDDSGECIGIITSQDLVQFEAVRSEVEQEISHGDVYNKARYGSGEAKHWKVSFGEVGMHMSKKPVNVGPNESLRSVAGLMCQNHIHHVLVLDEKDHPVGILSALDVISFMIGEPVLRNREAD